MRKIIVGAFTSLDGVMQAPGGPDEDPVGGFKFGGWAAPMFDEKMGAFIGELFAKPFDLLLGRKTYDSFYGAWPEREGEMAEKINSMRKLVASKTLGSSDWTDTTVIESDLEGEIAKVKEEDGGPILIAGSRSVAQQLLATGLVDQLNLQVFPLILGSGMRIFPESDDRLNLELASSNQVGNGVLIQQYRVA